MFINHHYYGGGSGGGCLGCGGCLMLLGFIGSMMIVSALCALFGIFLEKEMNRTLDITQEMIQKTTKPRSLIKLEDLYIPAEPEGDHDIVLPLFGTKKYHLFHFNPDQRIIEEDHLADLEREVRRKNMLMLFPI